MCVPSTHTAAHGARSGYGGARMRHEGDNVWSVIVDAVPEGSNYQYVIKKDGPTKGVHRFVLVARRLSGTARVVPGGGSRSVAHLLRPRALLSVLVLLSPDPLPFSSPILYPKTRSSALGRVQLYPDAAPRAKSSLIWTRVSRNRGCFTRIGAELARIGAVSRKPGLNWLGSRLICLSWGCFCANRG
eukprot:2806106-Rhodomonas_salina.2